MKKHSKIILGIFIFAASAATVTALCNTADYEIVLPQSFTLTAHTGCENTPDNSLEAISKGYECSADIVEFDVRFLTDGTPILSHDETVTAEVTLSDALALVSQYDGLKVNLDLKTTENLPAVLKIVEEFSLLQRVFYTGVEEKDVATVKEQTPQISYFLNTDVSWGKKKDREYLFSLADKTEKCGAVGININYKNCTKELVDIFHERGLLVSVWTVNSTRAMKKILPLGVDNITTRKPSELKRLITTK